MSSGVLEPKSGHEDAYNVRMQWGEAVELPIDTDGGLVENDFVSVSYLSSLSGVDRDDLGDAEAMLDKILR